jgi:hypothetical protein
VRARTKATAKKRTAKRASEDRKPQTSAAAALPARSKPEAAPAPAKPAESVAKCPVPPEIDTTEPLLKHLGGSVHDDWNQALCNQVLNAAKYPRNATPEDKAKLYFSHLAFLTGVNPQDVIEGMMAAQLFASHAAAMECYRRAMIPDQSLEGRTANLVHAAKLTRANAAMVEALAKHRNRGQQKVTVEHVHVYHGGQAIVGSVSPGGVPQLNKGQPHAIGHAAGAPMRSEDAQGLPLPISCDAERSVQDARGTVAGRA